MQEYLFYPSRTPFPPQESQKLSLISLRAILRVTAVRQAVNRVLPLVWSDKTTDDCTRAAALPRSG